MTFTPFTLVGGLILLAVIGYFSYQCWLGMRDHRKIQERCPQCGNPWEGCVTEPSPTVGNVYITYLICPNLHKMVAGSATGGGESLNDRLGGWAP